MNSETSKSGPTQEQAEAGGAELLKLAWSFPDCPTPGEGLVSTSEDWAAEEGWRAEYDKLDAEIKAFLAHPPATQNPPENAKGESP